MIHYERGVVIADGFKIRVEPLTETIYRYRSINEWLKTILVDDELYFATPAECNDPFDCRFEVRLEDSCQGLEKFLREQQVFAKLFVGFGRTYDGPLPEQIAPTAKLAQMTESELQAYAREIHSELGLGNPELQQLGKAKLESARDRMGVCCFAGRGDNLLMFAHYAAQHRGCCLEFQIRSETGGRATIFEDGGTFLSDVVYSDDIPVVQLYEMGTVESMNRVLVTKHSRWAYEEEVRAIRGTGPGPVRYRREALTGLVFGYRATAGDIKLVLSWLGPRHGVTLSKAVPNQNAGLDLLPLNG